MCTHVCTHTHTHTPKSPFLSETGKLRVTSVGSLQKPPVVLVFMVVVEVTLAMCTLLFWLLLYSQYYTFSVLSFVTLYVTF